MLSRLASRLARLEARRAPVTEPPYTPPEFPPGWFAEFFRLVRHMGQFGTDVLVSLGWAEEEGQQFMALAESDFESFLAGFEETPTDTI